MANKFKVGDKVIGNDNAGIYNITNKGWVGEVSCVIDDEIIRVRNKTFPGGFPVLSNCFDLLDCKNNQKIVITTDGKRTTAVLYDGKKRVKEAYAVLSDDDTFDFMTDAKIACERLTEEKEPERDLSYLLTDGIFGKNSVSGLFVVVGDKMIYESGGYDRIIYFNANLEGCYSHIDEIYGNAVSFDSIRRGIAVTIWKRKEIK